MITKLLPPKCAIVAGNEEEEADEEKETELPSSGKRWLLQHVAGYAAYELN